MEITEAGYLRPVLKVQIDYAEYQQVPTRHRQSLNLRQRPVAAKCLGPLFLINWLNPSRGLADARLRDRHWGGCVLAEYGT